MGRASTLCHFKLNTLIYIFLHDPLFSHHEAGTGAETFLPVTELSQPAPQYTVYSAMLA